jgi:hypothetical protein
LLVISAGLLMIVFGSRWSGALFASMPDTALGDWLSLVIPYIPLGVIGIGAALFVRSREPARAT